MSLIRVGERFMMCTLWVLRCVVLLLAPTTLGALAVVTNGGTNASQIFLDLAFFRGRFPSDRARKQDVHEGVLARRYENP